MRILQIIKLKSIQVENNAHSAAAPPLRLPAYVVRLTRRERLKCRPAMKVFEPVDVRSAYELSAQ